MEISRLKRGVESLWVNLTNPSPKIINPTVRFQARIVTITIIILLLTVGLSVMANSDLSPLTLLLLIAGYFISRTRYFIFSAFLVIANISFFVIIALFNSTVFTREIVFMTVAWLTPSLILAGLIFSIRQMLLISAIHFLVPLLLPIAIDGLEFRQVYVAGGFILVVSAMIVVSMYLRNQLEREKQKEMGKLNEELEERVYERTAQLESFSYSVSHDLRAPLRAIQGFSEIIASDYRGSLDEEGRMYLDRIRVSSKKMDHLIEDLLMLARLGRRDLNLEEIHLDKFADAIFNELVSAEEKADQFHFQAEKCPPTAADTHLVGILLTNLISNALKFSRSRRPGKIFFGCQQSQGRTEYFIKDNGIGFDPQLTKEVVRPFHRLHSDDEYEGTGVGLAIVKNIVKRHNGRLRIETKPGEGATVFFTL